MKALFVIFILMGAVLFAFMSVAAFLTAGGWLDVVAGTAFGLLGLASFKIVWSKLRK